MMRIAIADDSPDDRSLVADALRRAGYACNTLTNGREMVAELRRDTYDLVVVDWNMPGMTGLEVIQWSHANLDPVPACIVVTGRNEKSDVISALEAGADDYIVKPESPEIIVARVAAALRRGGTRNTQGFVEKHGPFRFDRLGNQVLVNDAPVQLTAKEFALAQLFFTNINRPLSRGYIMQRVWNSSADITTRTVDMHVSRLRTKLGLRPENGYSLQTVFGYGYRLDSLGESNDNEG